MLFTTKLEPHLASIANSLRQLVELLESQAHSTGTSLRTNYSDGLPDASYATQVDDEAEFLRSIEEAVRIAEGRPKAEEE